MTGWWIARKSVAAVGGMDGESRPEAKADNTSQETRQVFDEWYRRTAYRRAFLSRSPDPGKATKGEFAETLAASLG